MTYRVTFRMLLCGGFGLAMAAAPIAFDGSSLTVGGAPAFAHHAESHAGGQGATKDKGAQHASNGHAKSKVAKDDPMHPSNLGRLNGFLNASPQALANTSANSAIGILSKTYAEALGSYLGLGEEEETDIATEDDLAAILAKAANKPLTSEQIDAINAKLAEQDEDLAGALDALAEQETDDTPDDPTDDEPTLSDTLADLANEIQETETNQGLGNGDTDDGDSEDGEGDFADDVGDAVVDTADAVGDAVGDTVDAAGNLIESVF
jgi:hypothetical protein